MRRADDFSIEPSGDLEQQLGAALGGITGRALAAGQRHEPRPAARPVIEILSRRPDGTVSVNPDGTFTQAGAKVVPDSIAQQEYEECVIKTKAVRDAARPSQKGHRP